VQVIRDLLLSKINWAQIIGIVATVAGLFGLELTMEQQIAYVATIQAVQAAVTAVLRTFFTKAEPK
jgi:hypothetical protein